MKVCAQCHDEYRDDIETCFRCGVELTHSSEYSGASASLQTLDLSKAVKVIEGTLPGCKEIEALLTQNKIACQLVPVTAGNVVNYAVCVDESKVQDFARIMQTRFSNMVQREHASDWESKEVHLDGGDVTCPACGHVGALQEGQCADCGLVLAVSEV